MRGTHLNLDVNRLLIYLLFIVQFFGINSYVFANAPIVSAGGEFVVATDSNGTLWSWGLNSNGELAIGTTGNSLFPVKNSSFTDIIRIASGARHNLAIKTDGTLWVWGLDSNGQLGNGPSITQSQLTPSELQTLPDVIAIAAGDASSFAVDSSGDVWAWGRNDSGQLGDGTIIYRDSPVQVPGLNNIIDISASIGHTVALKDDGTVWAWGDNFEGKLGDGSESTRLTPVEVKGIDNVIAVSAGWNHTIALKSDGTVWSWGSNCSDGELGISCNTISKRSVPGLVPGLSHIVAIVAGAEHNLALRADGTVWAWGSNRDGQIGIGSSDTGVPDPTQVPGLANVIAIAGSNYPGIGFSLAIESDGSVWSWGKNSQGQLGYGQLLEIHNTPGQVQGAGGSGTLDLGGPIEMPPKAFNDSYITVSGGTYTEKLQAGDLNGDTLSYSIINLPTQSNITSFNESTGEITFTVNIGASGEDSLTFKVNDGVQDSNTATVTFDYAPEGIKPRLVVYSGSDFETDVLKNDGTIWQWGGPNENNEIMDVPTRIESLTDVVMIDKGDGFTLALKSDGTVWERGTYLFEESAGVYQAATHFKPVKIEGLPQVKVIIAAGDHRLALDVNGNYWGWGANNDGSSRNIFLTGVDETYITPVQLTGFDGFNYVASNIWDSYGMKSDGSIWGWGANGSLGLVGDGTNMDRPTPVNIPELQNATSISVGTHHSLAIRPDGRVLAWGLNNYGQIGDGTSGNGSIAWKSSPVLVKNLNNIVMVSAGGHYFSLALKSDGTVWAWGNNSDGQLGNGTQTDSPVPVMIPGLTDVIAITAGSYFGEAMRSDGTVWAWGYAAQAAPFSLTPVQINPPNGYDAFKAIEGNPKPDAQNISISVNDTDVYQGNLLGSDIVNDPLTYSIVDQPVKGTVTITDTATGAFTYTPIADKSKAFGKDTFTYKVNDGVQNSEVATVTVTILDTVPPTVSITNPAEGSFIDQLVNITGSVHDNSGAASVKLKVTDGTYYLERTVGGVLQFTDTPATVDVTDGVYPDWTLNVNAVPFVGRRYTVTATATDNDGNTAEDSVAFTYITGGQAFTTLDLNLSTNSILFNGSLDASVKLTKPGDASADLSGLDVILTVTDPDGIQTVLSPLTVNQNGQATVQGLGTAGSGITFNKHGTWTIQASFEGNAAYAPSQSTAQLLLVGTAAGYAVLVQGKIDNSEGLASHNKTLNRIYRAMKTRGFVDQNIFYYNYDTGQTGVDAQPDKSVIQDRIETLADLVNYNPAPIYIVFVDHGGDGTFFLDGSAETITPAELNTWLGVLESRLSTQSLAEPRVLLIGACYSGGFVDQLSAPGRIIVTSAAANEESYKGPQEQDGIRSGEYFMDELFDLLGRGETLADSFQGATAKTETFTRRGGSANTVNPYFDQATQHPLLDDNGDGIGSNVLNVDNGDGGKAKGLFLGTGANYDTNSANNPADVVTVTPTLFLADGVDTATLTLTANDNTQVNQAFVEIRYPAKILDPQNGTEQLSTNYDRHILSPVGDHWETTLDLFNTPGRYEVFYYVQDAVTGDISPARYSVVYRNKGSNPPPSSFSLLTPNGDSTKTVTVFDWTDATANTTGDDPTDPTGVTYTLYISDDPNMDVFNEQGSTFNGKPGMFKIEGLTASHAFVDDSVGLKDLSNYHWDVVAVDGFGARTKSDNGPGGFGTDNQNNIPGIITGLVHSNANFARLAGASVAASVGGNTGTPVVTDKDGSFILIASSGEASVSASLANYDDSTTKLTVQPGKTTEGVSIGMSRSQLAGTVDVSVSITPGVTSVLVGQNLSYTVLVSNAGPDPADNVVLTQELPGTAQFISANGCNAPVTNTLACTVGTLTAGSNAVFTVTVKPQSTGNLSTNVSVTSDTYDPVSTNNTDSVQVTATTLDGDGDGIADAIDNCPTITNADQTDNNGNGVGDACETDDDFTSILLMIIKAKQAQDSGQ